MKVECLQEKIKGAVALAEKITGKNLSLPVLSTVLLLAKGKSLKVRATNLDLGIEIEIPAKILEEGIVAMPGTLFHNLLSNSYDKIVFLEIQNDNVVVQTKNSRTLIKSFPHDDFPTLPSISKEKESFEVRAEYFVSGLRSVWFAAATSDIKPEISSVFLSPDSGDLTFVATDSFRLAEKKIDFISEKNFSSLIIPLKNVADIIRVFDAASGDILVSFNESQIVFEHEGVYLASRLIDGIFPDYKQIMPKSFTTEAVMLKQDFANALRGANVFSGKWNHITMSIDPAHKKVELQSKNPDTGENTTNIEAALTGAPVSLRFNHKYVSDCLQSIFKDSISLECNGESKPMLVRGVGDRSFTYVVMPLNQ